MASVKIEYFTRKTYADGSHPVRIKVIHNRKVAVKTLFSIEPKYWVNGAVKSSHNQSSQFNKLISNRLLIARERILQYESEGRDFTCHDIFYDVNEGSTLRAAIDDYAEGLNYRNRRKYLNLGNHIDNFRPHIPLGKVDLDFIEKFKKYLFSLDKINSPVTVNRYIKFLKTALNAQLKKGNFTNHAVLQYPTPKGSGTKVPLTREEFDRLKAVEFKTLSRDVFCLLVYLRGIRIGDLLQLQVKHWQNDRMVFTEQKTGKRQDIRLIDPAKEILLRYEGQSNWYLLPVLRQEPTDPKHSPRFQKHIESHTAVINRDLKIVAAAAGIKKNLSTHVARHTFASWADRSGLSSREIMNMLNHSSLSVTENYLEGLRRSSELDDAADRVFG